MKKFSDRINADWTTPKALAKLLNEFFEDEEEPKTLTHLYCWLNIDWVTMVERQLDPKFSDLLIGAENYCERWVVDNGFTNDKSFARWYLTNYHGKEAADATDSKGNTIQYQEIKS